MLVLITALISLVSVLALLSTRAKAPILQVVNEEAVEQNKAIDTNNDNTANGLDLSIVLTNWGKTGENLAGDVNNDRVVNNNDLDLVLESWKQ